MLHTHVQGNEQLLIRQRLCLINIQYIKFLNTTLNNVNGRGKSFKRKQTNMIGTKKNVFDENRNEIFKNWEKKVLGAKKYIMWVTKEEELEVL